MQARFKLLLILVAITPSLALAESRFLNLEKIVREINLGAYYRHQTNTKPLKIAILDNGFQGWEKSVGKFLPAHTKYHAPAIPTAKEEVHGLYMAELFYALLTDSGLNQQYIPAELHLYPTYGYTNLKNAISEIVANKIDLVLYAQNWDFGGNFDGHGFINALVNQARAAGTIWINAAGNNRGLTYNSRIPKQEKNLRLSGSCKNEATGKCLTRIALSWSDFKDEPGQGTNKDLDLYLYQNGKLVAKSELKQKISGEISPNESLYPREIISAELKIGEFKIKVKTSSTNFARSDRLRVTLSGDWLEIENADDDESIAPPADNKNVITVGALDASRSSISERLQKPDLWTKSLVTLTDKNQFQGSSTAAAIVAAGITVLKSVNNQLNQTDILALMEKEANNSAAGDGQGLRMEVLGFTPDSGVCFRAIDPDLLPQTKFVKNAIRLGGTAVRTSAGVKILFTNDPAELLERVKRIRLDDILIIGPGGSGVYPRNMLYRLPQDFFELAQIPFGQRICSRADLGDKELPGKIFRLPAKN